MITLPLLHVFRTCPKKHISIVFVLIICLINSDLIYGIEQDTSDLNNNHFKSSYFLNSTQIDDTEFRPINMVHTSDKQLWNSVQHKSQLDVSSKLNQRNLNLDNNNVQQKVKTNTTDVLKTNDANFNMEHLIKEFAKFIFIYTNGDSSRLNQTSKNINSTDEHAEQLSVDELKANWFVKVFNCIRSRNILQCMRIFFLQRTISALDAKQRITSLDDILFSSSVGKNKSNFQTFENLTINEIDQKILTTLHLIFNKQPFKFHFLPNLEFHIIPRNNTELSLATKILNLESTNETQSRGLKSMLDDMMPWPYIPSIFWATVLPLMIPKIKIAVMFAMMINQVAFMMALMSLMRDLIFGRRKGDDVVYTNYGYKKQPWHYGENLYYEKGALPPKILVHEKWIDD